MLKKNKFVCDCKCVTKREIASSIRTKGATSFNDVRTITMASTGCGRCKFEVESIVNAELNQINAQNIQYRINFGD